MVKVGCSFMGVFLTGCRLVSLRSTGTWVSIEDNSGWWPPVRWFHKSFSGSRAHSPSSALSSTSMTEAAALPQIGAGGIVPALDLDGCHASVAFDVRGVFAEFHSLLFEEIDGDALI